EDGAAEGSAQPDEGAHVDSGGRHQPSEEGQAGHAAYPGHLRRVHPQTRDQARREDSPPAAPLQQPGHMLQRLARAKGLGHSHQTLPAEEGEDLPSRGRARQDGCDHRQDEDDRVHPSAGDGDASNGKHQVARGKRNRDPGFFNEHQGADHDDQHRPFQALDPADGIHSAILRRRPYRRRSAAALEAAAQSQLVTDWVITTAMNTAATIRTTTTRTSSPRAATYYSLPCG